MSSRAVRHNGPERMRGIREVRRVITFRPAERER